MSYKPEKKYIVELKNVTQPSVYGYGGYWFSNSSSGTPRSSETIGSFEILRNDFTIDTSDSSAGKWHITEAGSFLVKCQAIMIVNQDPVGDDINIMSYNSNTYAPYTPSTIHGVGTRLHTEYFRSTNSYSMAYNSVLTDFHAIEHSWVQESTGGAGGNMYIFSDRIDIYNGIVDEFLYQRIEITKL